MRKIQNLRILFWICLSILGKKNAAAEEKKYNSSEGHPPKQYSIHHLDETTGKSEINQGESENFVSRQGIQRNMKNYLIFHESASDMMNPVQGTYRYLGSNL